MSRGKNLLKNTWILGIGTILPKFSQIITLPLYTAVLSKEAYGTYDLVLILSALLVPIVTLQIERAAFRFLISEKDSETQSTLISNLYFFIFPISLASAAFVFLLIKNLDESTVTALLISAYILIEVILGGTRQVARGLGKNKVYSVSSIINSLFNVVFALIFLAIFDFGLTGLLLSLVFSVILSLIYLIYSLSILNYINYKYLDINYIKKMLKFSIPMVPNTVSIWLVQASDRILITSLLGIESNALYAIANKIPNIFSLAYGTFNMAWQESASITYNDVDSEKYYSEVFNNLYNFLTGVMSLLIGFSPILFRILVNESYSEAYYLMPFIYISTFLSSLNAFYGGIYIAAAQTKKIGQSSIFGAIIKVSFSLLFMKRFGLYAAVYSSLISYFALVVYRMIDTKQLININYYWRKNFFFFIILILMSFINYQNNIYLNFINMIGGVVVGIILNKPLLKNLIYSNIHKFKK